MANVVIEPQSDGYPLIGRTGNVGMRSTKEVGYIILKGGVRHAFVEIETYKLLLDAATELARLQSQIIRLKAIIDAQRTKDD